jgi:hypothetical protein
MESYVTTITRIHYSYPRWQVTRLRPRVWEARITLSPTCTRFIYARSALSLEDKLEAAEQRPIPAFVN